MNDDNFKIINFKSDPAISPFAPEWNYFLCESIIEDIDFSDLAKFILAKEKEILAQPPTIRNGKFSDGNTGLGENSTTSRFDRFNVLNWDHPSIEKIKSNILNFHDKFLSCFQFKAPNDLYIQCWVNIMRKGEQIKPHIHSWQPECYLGGHICVQCEDTNTNYINPVNQINNPKVYESKNKVGKITLFQNCIPHYTDMHKGEEERITIAFDLEIADNDGHRIKIR